MFLFVVCRHVQCTPVGRTCRRADETKGTYNYGTHARFSFHFLFDGSVTVTGRPRQSRISSGLYLSSSKSRSIVHEWRSVRSVASACLRVRCVPWGCVVRVDCSAARAPPWGCVVRVDCSAARAPPWVCVVRVDRAAARAPPWGCIVRRGEPTESNKSPTPFRSYRSGSRA